jgi:hypothetical protein
MDSRLHGNDGQDPYVAEGVMRGFDRQALSAVEAIEPVGFGRSLLDAPRKQGPRA